MDNWTGFLRLKVEKKGKKTIPNEIYCYGAYKLTSPFYLENDAQACFYIMNPGGGFVDGDKYKMEIELSNHAELLLTTQSATKIYKTIKSPVTQEVNIILKAGALLEYIPDPIIGYKDARYNQYTNINMESGSCLISLEIITPGWDKEGNKFAYESLELKTNIYLDNKLILLDYIKFSPKIQSLSDIGFLEGYSHYGSMVVINEKVNNIFLEKLSNIMESNNIKTKYGLSMLSAPGFTLKVFGYSTQEVEKVFNICHQLIRSDWLGKQLVFLRKY